MKIRRILIYIIIGLLFTNCKKDNNNDSQSGAELFETFQVLEKTNDKFLENLDKNNGNPWISIAETGEWVKTLPGVKEVNYEDSVNIFIDMKSGRKTHLSFNELDVQGESVYRGGGNGNNFKGLTNGGGSCTNIIDNKKVLIYAAYYSDFYRSDPEDFQRVIDVFENAEDDFEVPVLKDAQCTPQIIETFGQYGFVIIDTHGQPESFSSGINIQWDSFPKIKTITEFKDYIDAKLGPQYFKMMQDDKILIGVSYSGNPVDPNWWLEGWTLKETYFTVEVTANYIASLGSTPNTMYLGNMCYSGHAASGWRCKKPTSENAGLRIRTAFLKLNPISYYCYTYTNDVSDKVFNYEAKRMEFALVKRLVEDGDSTGAAHLDNAGNLYDIDLDEKDPKCVDIYFNFRQYGKVDYCYGGCGDSIVDARDGQKYPTVCIGDQVWMAKNLNWAGAGSCYDNNSGNCNQYGRLYTQVDVTGITQVDVDGNPIGGSYSDNVPSGITGICPEGWHVPSAAEWKKLIDFCGGAVEAATKLRSQTGWPLPNQNTDDFGFGMLPAGWDNASNDGNGHVSYVFSDIGQHTSFWTTFIYAYGEYTIHAVIGDNMTRTDEGSVHKKMSCRCVKN